MNHPTNPNAVCVKREGGKGYHWIVNFDPTVHEAVEPPAPEPDESDLADPLNIHSASEEAVAQSAGKAPARKRKGK